MLVLLLSPSCPLGQIFPRFYFVSNVALLDMLANGTNPPKIMPYLGDCYDSLANLIFVTLEDGSKSTKTANEMVRSASSCGVSHEEALAFTVAVSWNGLFSPPDGLTGRSRQAHAGTPSWLSVHPVVSMASTAGGRGPFLLVLLLDVGLTLLCVQVMGY